MTRYQGFIASAEGTAITLNITLGFGVFIYVKATTDIDISDRAFEHVDIEKTGTEEFVLSRHGCRLCNGVFL